jgi:hypothetical protein
MQSEVVGTYMLVCDFAMPPAYAEYCKRAKLAEELATASVDATYFVVVTHVDEVDPTLCVGIDYESYDGIFGAQSLLVPETAILYIGTGRLLLAYDLTKPARLWYREVDCGFWGWMRHDDVVVMSAETDMFAYSLAGDQIWSAYVEPPWSYTVEGDKVHLDVMGKLTEFPLLSGPPA